MQKPIETQNNLNKLQKLHGVIKISFWYEKHYQLLKNHQEKDFWERVIEGIEGIIYNYKLKPSLVKYHIVNIEKEITSAEKHCNNFFRTTATVFAEILKTWWTKMQILAEDKFISQLEKDYEGYDEKKSGFLEGVAELRPLMLEKLKSRAQYLSFHPSKMKANDPTILILPRDLLVLFTTYLTMQQLANLEQTCWFFKQLIHNGAAWKLHLKNRINSNPEFHRFFLKSYPQENLDEIGNPQDKYRKVRGTQKFIKELRERARDIPPDFEYTNSCGSFSKELN